MRCTFDNKLNGEDFRYLSFTFSAFPILGTLSTFLGVNIKKVLPKKLEIILPNEKPLNCIGYIYFFLHIHTNKSFYHIWEMLAIFKPLNIFKPWPIPEGQAMVLLPPCRVVRHNLTKQTRTDMSVKVCNWSRVVDFLMTFSWLSHDCLMAVSVLSHDCLMTVS